MSKNISGSAGAMRNCNWSLSLLFLMIFSVTAQGQSEKPGPLQDIHALAEFTNADYNMGTLKTGKNTEFTVTIKNISTADTLEVTDIKVVCGCTTPKYRSHELILPGKTSQITLGFNGSARGEFTKTASIIFKGGYSKEIKFYGVAVAE